MPTKVFISWSGPLSQKLGEALHNWLPSTLQAVKAYFSPEDIEKGVKWSSEISGELGTSDIGIICLTRDNTEKPWILFEAGALSKRLEKSRVCPLLFDLEPSDLTGPLTIFQGTRFRREDFKRLVTTINSAAGDSRLGQFVLDKVFGRLW
jgi:TIR domain